MRVVLDTNVLIDACGDDLSVQARLIAAVVDGDLAAVVTRAMVSEYYTILARFIDDPVYKDRIEDFLDAARVVEPARVEVQIDDSDDKKFIAAALGGQATHLVTSDRHLLDIGEVGEMRMVTPQEAWALWQDEVDDAGQWRGWLAGLGL